MVWVQPRKYITTKINYSTLRKMEDYKRDLCVHPCITGIAVELFSAVYVTVCCIYVDRTTSHYFIVKKFSCEEFRGLG